MSTLLIRNGTVIDPVNRTSSKINILIEDGKIKKFSANNIEPAEKVLDVSGMIITPGLVDIHVHLREPGYTYKEDIHTGTNSAIVGGVTTVVCMPNTNPVIDCVEVINHVKARAENAKARVYVCAAITKGLAGKEINNFNEYVQNGVVAVSDDGHPVEDRSMMDYAMFAANEKGLPVISHCEDLAIIDGGIMHKGEISERLGVKGMDRLSEDSVTKREIEIARKHNIRIHIAHVSTKGSIDMIREAKKDGVNVTCETCPHYFIFNHEQLLKRDADFRMNPPLREQSDVEAIIEGIKDGTVDCIVTDHAPHTKKEKQDFIKAPNGTVGLETSFAASYKYLVEAGHINLIRLIELMTINPARILNLPAGTLEIGANADITVWDLDTAWTVLPERLVSKSKNTAFKFTELKGLSKYTIVGGNIIHASRR